MRLLGAHTSPSYFPLILPPHIFVLFAFCIVGYGNLQYSGFDKHYITTLSVRRKDEVNPKKKEDCVSKALWCVCVCVCGDYLPRLNLALWYRVARLIIAHVDVDFFDFDLASLSPEFSKLGDRDTAEKPRLWLLAQ